MQPAAFTAADLAHIRLVVADHVGTYHAPPGRLSLSDAVGYLIDAHLNDLADQHGLDTVRARVALVLIEQPDLLNHRYTWDQIDQRRHKRNEDARDNAALAFTACQDGALERALDLIDLSERLAPRVHGWDEIREHLRRLYAKVTATAPTTGPDASVPAASRAPRSAATASKPAAPTTSSCWPRRNTPAEHPSELIPPAGTIRSLPHNG